MQNTIKIYLSGVANAQTKVGGYGVVIVNPDGTIVQLSKGYSSTTNNRMELTAAIEALKAINPALNKVESILEVYSNSKYIANGISNWNVKKNLELWLQLKQITELFLNISYSQLDIYERNIYSEMASNLARQACEGCNLPAGN